MDVLPFGFLFHIAHEVPEDAAATQQPSNSATGYAGLVSGWLGCITSKPYLVYMDVLFFALDSMPLSGWRYEDNAWMFDSFKYYLAKEFDRGNRRLPSCNSRRKGPGDSGST